MGCRSVAIGPCLLFSLLSGMLGACTDQLARQVGQRLGASTPATTPRSAAFDARSSATNPQPPNSQAPAPTNRNPTASQATVSPPGEAITCEGNRHYADITWQQNQPYMRFGTLPNETMLNNVLAGVSRSPSGSVTYNNLRGETNTSVRFETDEITCAMRVIGANGTVTVDETGQVIRSNSGGNNEQRYWEGYNRGYERGYQDGRNARLYNSGYNPEGVFQSGAQSGNAEYDRGYRDGFFKGFSDGYNSVTPIPSPRPPSPTPTTGIPALW